MEAKAKRTGEGKTLTSENAGEAAPITSGTKDEPFWVSTKAKALFVACAHSHELLKHGVEAGADIVNPAEAEDETRFAPTLGAASWP